MTVITKPSSEKKTDKLDEPLVVAECVPHKDVEAGGMQSLPPQDPRILVLRTRARRASSITTACLLLMALLVMCCGILGGFYFYKQFLFSHHRVRGWCRIPWEQVNQPSDQAAFIGDYNRQFPEFEEFKRHKADAHFMNEEFDIDGDSESYERISVPTFDRNRNSRFVHDFNVNKTGIVDLDEHRCFVMPLNRSQVLMPNDLIDLVRKLWLGYYEIDTDQVKETMRVVLPPLEEPYRVGIHIEHECMGYPIYKLEKIVSGVYKRSIASEPVVFSLFAGKFFEFDIVNEDEVKSFERSQT